jgi:Helicase conserved C-terminal domain
VTGLRRFEAEGTTARRLGIVCFNARCAFNAAHPSRTPLPFILTDDTIYARAPSIVLGTIDKLAMLGQRTTTIRQIIGMFGLARGIGPTGHLTSPPNEGDIAAWLSDGGYQPVFPAFRHGQPIFFDPFPSLIIQDEAHLLEESLGTFSGLFDSLLDEVFTEIDQLTGDELHVSRIWQGGRAGGPRTPKVIAATATISNPDRQLEVLYQRVPLRFPCPGPDIYRSFFAEPAPAPAENPARVALEGRLPLYDVPERTSPWMRLFVSLMTNDATHTVTAVAVLSAFHSIITDVWHGLLDAATRAATADALANIQGDDEVSGWRRDAIRRAMQQGRENDLFALIDLHRITLAYVTNKKGGDQVMDALEAAVRLRHRTRHQPLDGFVSRLISGGIDMKEIQEIMVEAEAGHPGGPYLALGTQLRSIVATSAISHGVDVDRFNSMFFAGLPSDIAEYIQASSRVGRTHVGFVMLVPTPQSRRDRYVVETHDIFHRFLERMIAPPAVERWAENAIRRVLASLVQTWAIMRENQSFVRAADSAKARTDCFETISPIRALIRRDPTAFTAELGEFASRAIGFQGRGQGALGRPIYAELYRSLVEQEVSRFTSSVRNFDTPLRLHEYWEDSAAPFKPPMTSLRDVDEAGAGFDARITQGRRTIDQDDLIRVMRAIRQQRGSVAETDVDAPARAP